MTTALRLILLLSALTLFACEPAQSLHEPLPVDEVVRTTSPPIHALTLTVAGGAVPTELLCPPGSDPASWRPAPETTARFQRSRLIVSNGAGYERWVGSAPLPHSRVVSAADAVAPSFIRVKSETHAHGPEGTHTHPVTLGFVWLDPLHAIAQARLITRRLIGAFPEHEPLFSERFDALNDDLRALHARIENIDHDGVQILGPATPYAYLTERYGWASIQLPDDPSLWEAQHWPEPNEAGQPRIILCDQLPPPEVTATILATHNASFVLWHTGSNGFEGTYQDLLAANIERLELALDTEKP